VRIVIFEVEEWEREVFQELATDHEITFIKEALTPANAGRHGEAEVISTFIYSTMSAAVLERFPKLRLIATRSTGFDHIDSEYCQEHGVRVCNVPTYGDNTVAEHVFALLLAISHRMIEAVDRTRKGDFSQAGLQGFDLQDKTIGVVGTGSIGLHVIGIARGFGMSVLGYDVKPNQEAAQRLGFRYVDLDELLGSSDVVTLHVPANKHTVNLIAEDEFRRMKDGVVFINTARGPIVHIQALLEAIASGKVSAAGLDVLPEEPTIREEAELLHTAFRRRHNLETLLADHILLRMRNVLVTPHSAFNTREAVRRILETTEENITAFARGEATNVVT
jgi:D-lactate dehydrogenase